MNMLSPSAEAYQEMAHRWKWFVGFGIVLAILGVIALLNVVDATLVTTIFVGFLLIIAGIAQLVGAVTGAGGVRILQGVLGALYVIVGINIVADPLRGAIALTIVLGLMLMIGGFLRAFSAVADRRQMWGLTLLVGVIEVALGLWLLTGIPVSGIAIGFFVGLELLMGGFLWMVLGWALRSAGRETTAEAA